MRLDEICALLDLKCDETREIWGVSDLSQPKPNTVAFVRTLTDEVLGTIASNPETVFFVPISLGPDGYENALRVENPRLAYALVAREILSARVTTGVSSHAIVSEGAQLGDGVSIGPLAVIDDGAVIGARTRIGSHSRIHSGVVVGDDCSIGSHTVIGNEGFGFEVDETGKPIRISHIGGVWIGDDVEIGNHVSIAQGTIKPTRIDDDVKIDDCVFIAHNCHVERAAFIIAGAVVCGSVRVGEGAWISPASTIINQAVIGRRALVGLGAVVVGDVSPETVVAGVPAKPRGARA